MDQLRMMRVFVRVAQRSGFSAAAEDLGMSRAAVTKHVSAVESRLGVRLLDRTTRSVSMTEAGRIYLERCLECLQSFEDSEAAVSTLAAEPRGLLRVAGPYDFNRHLSTILARFMRAHPGIEIDLRLSNRTLHMVDEGIDVYLRITNSLDADSIARLVAITRFGVWGARGYFRSRRRPRTPADLREHRFAVFNEPPLLDEWILERSGRRVRVALRPAIATNSGEAMVAAVIGGAALGVIPSFLLPPNHTELIEPVLLDWSAGHRGVYVVYPHRRFVPSKVRAFVDFIKNEFGAAAVDPWWPAAIPVPEFSREKRRKTPITRR
jgi:DNA-binding transcriptional LysR family regulator